MRVTPVDCKREYQANRRRNVSPLNVFCRHIETS
jgi:hypothetical protein